MRKVIITLLSASGIIAAGAVACLGQGQLTSVLRAEGPVAGGIGVAAHHPADSDLDGIKVAGFGYVRTDLVWAKTEVARGIYDWQESDRRISAMSARGLRPILVLDYSNPLYAGPAPDASRGWVAPSDPAAVGAFTRWASAAAARYARARPIWELWNEPDTDGFWPPHADPYAYLQLAKSACAGIRAADGDATIWAPALSSHGHVSAVNSPFLKTVLASSLPSCLSAISVHPYAWWSELDRAPEYWRALRAIPTQTARPFVSSESGISNNTARITGTTQANYLVRMIIYDHMADVPVSILYDWRNDGRDPTQVEHNYGMKDIDGKPKPAFTAIAALVKQTAGLTRQCLVRESGRALLYDWRPDKPDQLLMVTWATSLGLQALSTNPPTEINVTLPGSKGAPSVNDLYGQKASVKQTGPESWQIDGGGQPYYIQYKGNLPAACS